MRMIISYQLKRLFVGVSFSLVIFAFLIMSVQAAGIAVNAAQTITDNKITIKNNRKPTLERQPKRGLTGTRLKIVEFSKEFEQLSKAVTVSEQQLMTFRWKTNQTSAVKGRWEVRNKSNNNQVLASGFTNTAPATGKFAQFSLPKSTFLLSNPPSQNVIFTVTIRPTNASNQAVGNFSTSVQITQLSAGNKPEVTQFNDGAIFPVVEMISF